MNKVGAKSEPIFFEAAPSAASLIEGLRDFGYTLDTDMADIIDNSITASASRVDIYTEFNSGQPVIAFLDDGSGMSKIELQNAMRPGSKHPKRERERNDLGRFGLGLKTASFSLARRLTVVTRKAGIESRARWDLDLVQEKDLWIVAIPSNDEVIPYADKLEGKDGTLVLWEKVDRLADEMGSDSAGVAFARQINDSVRHLELVFHRFLCGQIGIGKFSIYINDRELVARDPFNTSNTKTQQREEILIKYKNSFIKVKAFTLPHHSAVNKAEWEELAGDEGYTRNQGFYVYRAGRLIVKGTWFGLARQLESTRLARIRIDIPVELDVDWQVNVLKAAAQPPRPVREELRALIANLGHPSVRVYKRRGRILETNYKYPFWERVVSEDEISYRINLENPAIVALRKSLGSDNSVGLDNLLRCLARDLPVDTLFVDLGDNPEKVVPTSLSIDELIPTLRIFTRSMIQESVAANKIVEALQDMPIFAGRGDELSTVIRQLLEESD